MKRCLGCHVRSPVVAVGYYMGDVMLTGRYNYERNATMVWRKLDPVTGQWLWVATVREVYDTSQMYDSQLTNTVGRLVDRSAQRNCDLKSHGLRALKVSCLRLTDEGMWSASLALNGKVIYRTYFQLQLYLCKGQYGQIGGTVTLAGQRGMPNTFTARWVHETTGRTVMVATKEQNVGPTVLRFPNDTEDYRVRAVVSGEMDLTLMRLRVTDHGNYRLHVESAEWGNGSGNITVERMEVYRRYVYRATVAGEDVRMYRPFIPGVWLRTVGNSYCAQVDMSPIESTHDGRIGAYIESMKLGDAATFVFWPHYDLPMVHMIHMMLSGWFLDNGTCVSVYGYTDGRGGEVMMEGCQSLNLQCLQWLNVTYDCGAKRTEQFGWLTVTTRCIKCLHNGRMLHEAGERMLLPGQEDKYDYFRDLLHSTTELVEVPTFKGKKKSTVREQLQIVGLIAAVTLLGACMMVLVYATMMRSMWLCMYAALCSRGGAVKNPEAYVQLKNMFREV